MKRYLSFLLAFVLGVSMLAGCSPGPAEQSSDNGAQSNTETTIDPGLYLIFVLDEETSEPIEDVRVQFCSDSQCMLGKSDSSGVVEFHVDPGTYTAHLVKTPEGYEENTDEYTLKEGSQVATFYLKKDGTEIQTQEQTEEQEDPKLQAEWDFPYTGFTFNVPDTFKDYTGAFDYNDGGEPEPGLGILDGYMTYRGRTDAEIDEFLAGLGEIPEAGPTDKQLEAMVNWAHEIPSVPIFRVVGVRNDKDMSYVEEKEYFTIPIKVNEKIGEAGDYNFYYVVFDYEGEYWDVFKEKYPEDKFKELKELWEKAAYTKDFQDSIQIKEPETIYISPEDASTLSFKTTDLEGNSVTSKELFGSHKITMINMWATWCIHCQEELEELERLSQEWVEKDVQIIGVCMDANDDKMANEAIKILEENGVTYTNIRATDEMLDQLPYLGLPTSYFVDSEGNILDYPIAGAMVEKYPEKIEELLAKME